MCLIAMEGGWAGVEGRASGEGGGGGGTVKVN